MRKTFGVLFVPVLLSCLIAQPAPGTKQATLVVAHVTVIDATGAPARPDLTVVITGDHITQVGESAEVRVPKDAQVVDATGKRKDC